MEIQYSQESQGTLIQKFGEAVEVEFYRQNSSCSPPKWSNIQGLVCSLKRFQKLTITGQTQQKIFVNDLLKYVELVMGFLSKYENAEYRRQRKFASGCLEFIPEIFKNGDFANLFVQEATVQLFDLLTYGDYNLVSKRALLTMYNEIIARSKKQVRIDIAKKLVYYMYRLLDHLSTHGDFVMQSDIMETLFRIFGNEIRSQDESPYELLPGSRELGSSLRTDISVQHFDKDVRGWLNKFNKDSKSIFSIPCKRVLLGTKVCLLPGGLDKMWVDFNLKELMLGFYCQNPELDTWDRLVVLSGDVHKAEVKRPLGASESTVSFQLNKSCICDPSNYQDHYNELGKHLKLIIGNEEKEKVTKLITTVLPQIFGDTFSHTSSKIAVTPRNVYKPLSIKISKGKSSASDISVSTSVSRSRSDAVSIVDVEREEKNIGVSVTSTTDAVFQSDGKHSSNTILANHVSTGSVHPTEFSRYSIPSGSVSGHASDTFDNSILLPSIKVSSNITTDDSHCRKGNVNQLPSKKVSKQKSWASNLSVSTLASRSRSDVVSTVDVERLMPEEIDIGVAVKSTTDAVLESEGKHSNSKIFAKHVSTGSIHPTEFSKYSVYSDSVSGHASDTLENSIVLPSIKVTSTVESDDNHCRKGEPKVHDNVLTSSHKEDGVSSQRIDILSDNHRSAVVCDLASFVPSEILSSSPVKTSRPKDIEDISSEFSAPSEDASQRGDAKEKFSSAQSQEEMFDEEFETAVENLEGNVKNDAVEKEDPTLTARNIGEEEEIVQIINEKGTDALQLIDQVRYSEVKKGDEDILVDGAVDDTDVSNYRRKLRSGSREGTCLENIIQIEDGDHLGVKEVNRSREKSPDKHSDKLLDDLHEEGDKIDPKSTNVCTLNTIESQRVVQECDSEDIFNRLTQEVLRQHDQNSEQLTGLSLTVNIGISNSQFSEVSTQRINLADQHHCEPDINASKVIDANAIKIKGKKTLKKAEMNKENVIDLTKKDNTIDLTKDDLELKKTRKIKPKDKKNDILGKKGPCFNTPDLLVILGECDLPEPKLKQTAKLTECKDDADTKNKTLREEINKKPDTKKKKPRTLIKTGKKRFDLEDVIDQPVGIKNPKVIFTKETIENYSGFKSILMPEYLDNIEPPKQSEDVNGFPNAEAAVSDISNFPQDQGLEAGIKHPKVIVTKESIANNSGSKSEFALKFDNIGNIGASTQQSEDVNIFPNAKMPDNIDNIEASTRQSEDVNECPNAEISYNIDNIEASTQQSEDVNVFPNAEIPDNIDNIEASARQSKYVNIFPNAGKPDNIEASIEQSEGVKGFSNAEMPDDNIDNIEASTRQSKDVNVFPNAEMPDKVDNIEASTQQSENANKYPTVEAAVSERSNISQDQPLEVGIKNDVIVTNEPIENTAGSKSEFVLMLDNIDNIKASSRAKQPEDINEFPNAEAVVSGIVSKNIVALDNERVKPNKLSKIRKKEPSKTKRVKVLRDGRSELTVHETSVTVYAEVYCPAETSKPMEEGFKSISPNISAKAEFEKIEQEITRQLKKTVENPKRKVDDLDAIEICNAPILKKCRSRKRSNDFDKIASTANNTLWNTSTPNITKAKRILFDPDNLDYLENIPDIITGQQSSNDGPIAVCKGETKRKRLNESNKRKNKPSPKRKAKIAKLEQSKGDISDQESSDDLPIAVFKGEPKKKRSLESSKRKNKLLETSKATKSERTKGGKKNKKKYMDYASLDKLFTTSHQEFIKRERFDTWNQPMDITVRAKPQDTSSDESGGLFNPKLTSARDGKPFKKINILQDIVIQNKRPSLDNTNTHNKRHKPLEEFSQIVPQLLETPTKEPINQDDAWMEQYTKIGNFILSLLKRRNQIPLEQLNEGLEKLEKCFNR